MSLSSFLLPSKAKDNVDTELDSLFKANAAVAGPSSQPDPNSGQKDSKSSGKKRKVEAQTTEEPAKRRKSDSRKAAPATDLESKAKSPQSKETKKAHKRDEKGKGKISDDEESEEENSDLENAYIKAHDRQPAKTSKDTGGEDDSEEEEDSNAEEGDDAIPVHESLKKGKKSSSRSGPKQKYVPQDETPEQRNQRTIFVGNLSSEVAQKRPLQKQLQRHILQYIPNAKIESTRFRSVAFATPTTDLSKDASDAKSPPKKKSAGSDPKSARQHDLERTSAWRDRQEDESLKNDEKKYLTPAQKKKIAFINQEFHSSADTVNAYIVFAHPIPADQRPANLPPPPEVLDPYEAAKRAATKCDGTTFMERSIRVDLVGGKGGVVDTAGKESGKGEDFALIGADPKLSVFVGNLDFASKEEDLRVFFEGVITAEKGAPVSEGEDASGKKYGWVTRVRIVRDKDTQMGKGFAYVQFADRECVDEVLAMEEGKLKFAKRKLRVQRCKTLPGSSTSTRHITSESKKPAQGSSTKKQSAPTPIIIPSVPKGDPALGEKLAGLSKDARKQAKATDADRVARRLAKKKARAAMAKGGPTVSAGGAKDGKERQRVRKSGKAGAGGSGKPRVKKVKSGRVRSEKAISKMNGKKSG